MSVAQEILQGVEFSDRPIDLPGGRLNLYPDEIAETAFFNDELGFVQVPAHTIFDRFTFGNLAENGRIFLLGFSVPTWQTGGSDLPEAWKPLVHLDQIPEKLRTIGRQGKGVGPRMYNTTEATVGANENWQQVGAYVFRVAHNRISTVPSQSDMAKKAQHAAKKIVGLAPAG
ncbi:MAG TPA: hypothetical protein VHB51_00720 [Candidatus Saccharimonadales bacterium]|nr:hypothetical protein [Candidatus Saccharimonadales bacterium]